MTTPYAKLAHIFVRKATFESQVSPYALKAPVQWSLSVSKAVNPRISEFSHSIELTVIAEGLIDGTPTLKAEVRIEGVVESAGLAETELTNLLESHYPNHLVGYARTQLANLTSMTGFAPVVLPPVIRG